MKNTPPVAPTAAPTTFQSLGLPTFLVEYLDGRGITVPTPIQAAVIPHALGDGDLLAQARTGSGKTLAFLLPLAARAKAGEIRRVWVVCPTRELAQQAAREAALLLGEAQTATLVGGQPIYPQIKELRREPIFVFGTPGRMCDHLNQGSLKPDAEIVVLDEADQMMDMGFSEDLDRLVKDLGESVARWLFSATFPRQVQDAVDRWLDKPHEIRLDSGSPSSHVPQHFTVTKPGEERLIVARLLHILEPTRALVFVRTRDDVDTTVRSIAEEGMEAAGISGNLTQEARERVLERFRSGKLAVLVATDVAARGIDVPGVTHVFNLGLPMNAEAYSHRVGRTARAGAGGEAWTVLARHDRVRFIRMAGIARCRPVEAPVPTGASIVEAKRQRLAKRVQDSLGEKLTLPTSFTELTKEFGAEAVLAALVHRLVPDAPPEKTHNEPRKPSPGFGAPSRGGAYAGTGAEVSLFLGIGMDDGIQSGNIVAMLCNQCGLSNSQLGKIRLHPRHALINVSDEVAQQILSHPPHHRGRSIPVRPDRVAGGEFERRPGPPPFRRRK